MQLLLRPGLLARLAPSPVHVARFSSAAASAAPPVALGFIGLGNMGARMAARLLEAGHPLVVYDVDEAALGRAAAQGATVAKTPAAVASTRDLAALVTMLPSSQHVLDVYCAEGRGVFAAPGGVRSPLLIDCSTIDPGTARVVAASAQGAPLHADVASLTRFRAPLMMDAPVSGGVAGAAAGTLTFMCGGKQEAIAAAEPVLAVMGKRVVHCGPSGNGQAAKLCNNLVLAIQMAGISEGLAMGRRLGLDPKLLSDIFNSSTAACWSSHTNNPCPGVMEGVPASREYEGGFGSSLMLKDLGLAMAAAEQCASPVPVGSLVEQLYRVVVEEGGGRQDFSSIFRHIYREGHAGPKPCKHPHPDEGERRDG
eukprot:jgi/Tetstr1/434394/TSEL_023495.t1